MSITSYLVIRLILKQSSLLFSGTLIKIFLLISAFSTPQQHLGEEELSEGGVESRWSPRSAGLTAQLQALRKALYHKYVQEVAALKEQHSSELRILREEREQERKREERQEERGQDLNGINSARSSTESLGAAGQVVLEEKQHWERVEEEVAKVGGHAFYIFM